MFGAFSSLADLDDQDDAHDAFHNDKVVSETSRDTRNSYLVLGYNGSILPEFEPDALCERCSDIFKALPRAKELTEPETLHLDASTHKICRLCAVLYDKWGSAVPKNGKLTVDYWVDVREGYFMGVRDLIFKPKSPVSTGPEDVRFGLQLIGDTDISNPETPAYRTSFSKSTRLQDSLPLIRDWLAVCNEHGGNCQSSRSQSTFIPSRLIHIFIDSKKQLGVRLRSSSDFREPVKYATLSHCWGQHVPLKLKSAKAQRYRKQIPFQDLSPLFRDAIRVAAALDIWYLWIDSLCIVQDSEADWHTESAMMSEVYSNGYLNIAADGFADGSHGLFVDRDPQLLRPLKVSISDGVTLHVAGGDMGPLHSGDHLLLDINTWKDEVDAAPLGKRGWVVQERALSPRTLHFGKYQLSWECLNMRANEVFPDGFVMGTLFDDLKSTEVNTKPHNGEEIEVWEILSRKVGNVSQKTRKQYLEDDSDSEFDDDFADEFSKFEIDLRKRASHHDYASTDAKPKTLEELNSHVTELFGLDPSMIDDWKIADKEKVKALLQEWHWMMSPKNLEPPAVKYMTTAQRRWHRTIAAYTRCALTFTSDKLVAIAGMAKMMSEHMQCEYLAGLWRKDLEHHLLWKVVAPAPAVAPNGKRGPSWSWASVDGAVDFDWWIGTFYHHILDPIRWLSRIESVHVELAGHDPFGHVRGGSLVITGPLGILRVSKTPLNLRETDTNNSSEEFSNHHIITFFDTNEDDMRFPSPEQSESRHVRRYNEYGKAASTDPVTSPYDIFYLPLRLMDQDYVNADYQAPLLQGLLLLPIADGENGTYRRIGHLAVSEQGGGGEKSKETIAKFCECTKLRDPRLYRTDRENGEYTICVV